MKAQSDNPLSRATQLSSRSLRPPPVVGPLNDDYQPIHRQSISTLMIHRQSFHMGPGGEGWGPAFPFRCRVSVEQNQVAWIKRLITVCEPLNAGLPRKKLLRDLTTRRRFLATVPFGAAFETPAASD